MFRPPRCPNPTCSKHLVPTSDAFLPHGHYQPKCRRHPVPRFRCRACGRTFSRQTFRTDYRDHRPDLNARLLRSIASGLGLRQSSRKLRLSLRCTELKLRKLARHLRDLNLNTKTALSSGASFRLDGSGTFEGRRNTRPLTIPMLIEKESRNASAKNRSSVRPTNAGQFKGSSRLRIVTPSRRPRGRSSPGIRATPAPR